MLAKRVSDAFHDSRVAIPRRKLLVRSLAAVAAPPAAAIATRLHAAAQTEVGAGPVAVNAFEFVATIRQRAFEFIFSGYLTQVEGIDPSFLFSTADPTNRDAASARLTLFGVANGTARSILEQVFVVNALGEIGISYNEAAGADDATPESFQAGTQVATAQINIQSVVNVTAPLTGLNTASGDLVLSNADPFSIAESTFLFRTGEPRSRLNYAGQGNLLDPELPEAILYVAGNCWSAG